MGKTRPAAPGASQTGMIAQVAMTHSQQICLAAQDVPQSFSKQLKHGGREQMQKGGVGSMEMMNLELMDYGVLRRVKTEVVYPQVTRSQCRRASSASATFVFMTMGREVCVQTLKSRECIWNSNV